MIVLLSMMLQQMVYSSSVDIRPEWAVVEQIPFSALAKLHYGCASRAACPGLHPIWFVLCSKFPVSS